MSLILDSSMTLAWVYREENNASIERVWDRVVAQGAWVPGLWRLEVANVLMMGVKRGRHRQSFVTETLKDLSLLSIRLDAETDRQACGRSLQLAERHQLTLYDAAYLELSQRRKMPIATLDLELQRAARREKIELLGD